jgi:AcrR family transcriptional regulator
MTVITGGRAGSIGGRELDGSRPQVLSPAEAEVGRALLRCVARWGLAKTTIEDVAKEAGVSRATVYRLFPGGKAAILDAAARHEIAALVAELDEALDGVEDLEELLVVVLHRSACFLGTHEALAFLRTHETVALEQLLAFDRLDTIFHTAGALLAPAVGPLVGEDLAVPTGVWLARLVVSYLDTPSPTLDLQRVDDVRRLVRTFVLPGLHPTNHPPSAAPSRQPD